MPTPSMRPGDLTWTPRPTAFDEERAEAMLVAMRALFPAFEYAIERDPVLGFCTVKCGDSYLTDSAQGADAAYDTSQPLPRGFCPGAVEKMTRGFMEAIYDKMLSAMESGPAVIEFDDAPTARRFCARAYKLRDPRVSREHDAAKWRMLVLSRDGAVVTARLVDYTALARARSADNANALRTTFNNDFKQDILSAIALADAPVAFDLHTPALAKQLLASIRNSARYERRKSGASRWDLVALGVEGSKLTAMRVQSER